MATISVSNVSDGETIDASDLNNPINTIVNEINGNLDNNNIASNAAIAQSKIAFTDWQDWTPSYTNLTVGNGTVVAKYCQIGKIVHFYWELAIGSTTSVSNGFTITAPVTAASYIGAAANSVVGTAYGRDTGTAEHIGASYMLTTTDIGAFWTNPTASTLGNASTNFPFTEASGDFLNLVGTYEAA